MKYLSFKEWKDLGYIVKKGEHAKKVDDDCAQEFKQKERARLVVLATLLILNSISGRISQLTK